VAADIVRTDLKTDVLMQRRRLIQPLAVVAASLTLTLLFSGMAMMDLRQVEKLIHAMLKQKAISVAENIEGASWNTYHRIWRHGGSPRNFPECDSMPEIQDSLPQATEDEGSARYRAMQISIRKAIAMWPVGRDIVYLAVEDNRGRLLAQTGNIPEEKVSECLLLAGNARGSGSPVSECVKIGDIKFLEVILPFTLGENVVGKIRIGLETYKSDVMLQENRRHIFLWAALMMLIGIAVMGILYRIQSRHLSRLHAMQEHLHHTERLSSLANLGAKVAHEVRNPLNAIGMAAQRLQREFVPVENEAQSQEFRHITQIVRDEIRRLNAIIEDFLSLSRSNRLHLHDESLVPVLERVLFLSREEAQNRNIHIEIQEMESTRWMVVMDAPKMEQAVLNIVRNAVDSISENGVIIMSLSHVPGKRIRIRIRDSGSGIAANETERIFDLHYTTKPCGTGLGLSIANEIVLAHGGEIQVQSRLNEGSVLDILLPESGAGHVADVL
jgi:signal transduction histidine kinase